MSRLITVLFNGFKVEAYHDLPKLANISVIESEILKKEYGITFDFTECQFKTHFFKIDKALSNLNNETHRMTTLYILKEYTKFVSGCEYWDITDLSRKYHITGKDVFLSLCKDTVPYCMGVLSHNPNDFDYEKEYDKKVLFQYYSEVYGTVPFRYLEDIKKAPPIDYNKIQILRTVHFDYVNGIGIKNVFPVDYTKTPFLLNMRRYNDRNIYTGYDRLIPLFSNRINRTIIE